MKKLLMISVIASGLLADSFINPLPNAVKAIDNGGTLSAIDAYKDGIGAELMDKPGISTDNSAMNTLVYKYGETAKTNNVTIVDQVVYGTSPIATQAEKALAGKLTIDGASCNDNNINSIGETWLNGTCQGGTMVNGTTCNDNNIQTINDIYSNNICSGTNVENQPCNDINIQTINDIYHNGVCAGTSVPNGSSCNDNNALTYADIYMNGICAGFTNGTTCNDGNSATYADKYTNGICAGVTNGTTCNDSNVQTINDVYTNGVCAGTNVEGQSCNDGYSQTVGEVYHNGVCQIGTVPNCSTQTLQNCTTCNTGYYLYNGSCSAEITVVNGSWSDGTKAATCWEYYNGKILNGKKYVGKQTSGTYNLADGRTPTCNMPALVAIHNNNNWSGLVTSDGLNCYTDTLISFGANADIFPHPMTSAYCTANVNFGNMFKSVSFYVGINATCGDGSAWRFDGAGITTETGVLPMVGTTPTKTLNNPGVAYFRTYSSTGNNGCDWIHYNITGYVE
jgi:hypothetical protein